MIVIFDQLYLIIIMIYIAPNKNIPDQKILTGSAEFVIFF